MRVTASPVHLERRKKVLRLAKGFRGRRKNVYRVAKNAVIKAGMHAYISRRQRKRQFRALWIVRINAGLRKHGCSYAKFMHSLKLQGIALNRKSLADMSMQDENAFRKLIDRVQNSS